MRLQVALVAVAVAVAACRSRRLRHPGPEEDCRLSRQAAIQREQGCGRHDAVDGELASLAPFRHYFRGRMSALYGHQYLVSYKAGGSITCVVALAPGAADPEAQWCDLNDEDHYRRHFPAAAALPPPQG